MTETEQIAELKEQLQQQQEQINALKASGSQRLEDKEGRGTKYRIRGLFIGIVALACFTGPTSLVIWFTLMGYQHY